MEQDHPSLIIPRGSIEHENGDRTLAVLTIFDDYTQVIELNSAEGNRNLVITDDGASLRAPGWDRYPYSRRISSKKAFAKLIEACEAISDDA